MFENVDGRRTTTTTDGLRIHGYPISSPVSELKILKNSSENENFYSCEILLYIACVCFCNERAED